MYYRLHDNQTYTYMHTGYNAKSIKELKEEYISYVSVDLSKKEIKQLESMNDKDIISVIEGNDFMVEKNKKKFEELNECF